MVFISQKNILTNFLRNKLTDPRARAEDETTEEFDGGGTTFTLTPPAGTLSCVSLVTVDAVTQTFRDYYIDFQNEKIIFYSNTAVGVNNVDVTYKYGTSNWIYPDKARTTLARTAFPRMNIIIIGGTGERTGQYNSNVESDMHFQIDVWTKENQKWTINSVVYEGDKLAEYLAHEVTKAFREHMNDLYPELYNYTLLGIPRDSDFNQEMQCFHKVIETGLKGINVGEVY